MDLKVSPHLNFKICGWKLSRFKLCSLSDAGDNILEQVVSKVTVSPFLYNLLLNMRQWRSVVGQKIPKKGKGKNCKKIAKNK